MNVWYTMWKVSKYGVISGPYVPAFGLDTGEYRPEITLYFYTFHAMIEKKMQLFFPSEISVYLSKHFSIYINDFLMV